MNLSGQDLSDTQIDDVLKLDLNHRFGHKNDEMMSISEDLWDQINKLDLSFGPLSTLAIHITKEHW